MRQGPQTNAAGLKQFTRELSSSRATSNKQTNIQIVGVGVIKESLLCLELFFREQMLLRKVTTEPWTPLYVRSLFNSKISLQSPWAPTAEKCWWSITKVSLCRLAKLSLVFKSFVCRHNSAHLFLSANASCGYRVLAHTNWSDGSWGWLRPCPHVAGHLRKGIYFYTLSHVIHIKQQFYVTKNDHFRKLPPKWRFW